jgi:hypothetical protein
MLWLVFLLGLFGAGCGSGGEGSPPDAAPGAAVPTAPGAGSGVGGLGHGPIPLDLLTAGNFAILAEVAITNIPATAVTGDVGLSPASGAGIGLSCAEVNGAIRTVSTVGPLPCRVASAALLEQAVADGHSAWHDGRVRPPDYMEVGGGNIGGLVLPPATYKWSGSVRIPADLTLRGGPNDVWIFLVTQDLSVGAGVEIVLDGALPQNVFWLTLVHGVELGAASRFRGIIISETTIDMRAGASIDGRLMAAGSINLDQNRVTEP